MKRKHISQRTKYLQEYLAVVTLTLFCSVYLNISLFCFSVCLLLFTFTEVLGRTVHVCGGTGAFRHESILQADTRRSIRELVGSLRRINAMSGIIYLKYVSYSIYKSISIQIG